MPRYFPSRKVFVVGVLAIGLLAWSIVHERTSQQYSAIPQNFLGTVANAEVSFSDSDEDGLYDWEEDLVGTDENDKDSNNNGLLDGEEYEVPKVYAQINPVKFEEQLGLAGDGRIQNLNPNNLSETLLTTAVADYASLDGNIPQQTSNEIIDDLAKKIDGYELDLKYALNDIEIAESDDKNAKSTYLIEFLASLGENKEIYELDVLEIVSDTAGERYTDGVILIEQIANAYRNIVDKLSVQTVPKEIAVYHIALMNIFDNSAEALQDVKLYETDPIKSMAAAAAYTQFQSYRSKIIVDLTIHLSELFQ